MNFFNERECVVKRQGQTKFHDSLRVIWTLTLPLLQNKWSLMIGDIPNLKVFGVLNGCAKISVLKNKISKDFKYQYEKNPLIFFFLKLLGI